MKFFKQTFVILIFLISIGFLFRDLLYQNLVTYRSIGTRGVYSPQNEGIIDFINQNIKEDFDPDIKQIVKLGLLITSKKLYYTTEKNDNDPNLLINSEKAHCVGYASFFSTTCNYLLDKYNFSKDWKVNHQIGQIYFLGINIHNYFDSPFFKDHDFVTIQNIKSSEYMAVDPAINDYLHVNFITYSRY